MLIQMAAQVAFRAALGWIGFNEAAQIAVVAQGFTNIALLGLVTSDQVKQVCKLIREHVANPVPINIIQQQLLLAIRHWVINRQRLGLDVNADDFMAIIAYEQSQIMVCLQEDDTAADKEVVAKMPDKFKQPSQWKVFVELMETYLSQLKGCGRVPLNYVVCKIAVPIPGTLFATKEEQTVAIAPLTGDQYNKDNAKVYGILKQLCLEGPGRSYILEFDRVKNGRGAWLAMYNHYKGDSFCNCSKEEAYSVLDHLHYEGERKGFTFEKFVEKHNECYLELSRHNEPVYEEKKVRDFLNRINAPELQAAKQQVRSDANMKGNFQTAANFIALSVTPAKQSTRNVAMAHTDGRGGRGKGGRSGGRQSGGGRGYNRGRGRGNYQGRGHGRGRGRGGRGGINNTGYYTEEEWAALTREQRDSILEARGTKRNVGSIETDDGEPTPPGNDGAMNNANTNEMTSAGNEFGRRSRQRGHNYIGMLHSSFRQTVIEQVVARMASQRNSSNSNIEIGEYIKLDSHANTSVIGNNCCVISYTDNTCQVAPFHPNYESIQDIPIVQAGAAYDDPNTGETVILIINLAKDPSKATHSIFIPEHDVRIPLSMRGVISCLPIRKPTVQEIESCRWVPLTSEREWDPHSDDFAENERKAHENEHIVIHTERDIFAIQTNRFELQEVENMTPASLLHEEELLPRVIKSVQIQEVQSSQRRGRVTREHIASMWKVGLDAAARTLKATTQLVIRHALHPLHKRFRTEAAQLRYPRLGG
jgi:hypothetical protein